MDGIVEELLRLEGEKNKALVEANAPAYDTSVRAQLHLLDSTPQDGLKAAARKSPEELAALSRLLQHNTALFQNLISTSPVFAMNPSGYKADGKTEAEALVAGRIAVEA